MTEYSFIAEGKPQVKQRPRMTRRGRAYTPKATHDAERAIADQYSGPLFTTPVHVEVCYAKDHQAIFISEMDYEVIKSLRGDIDNYLKLTLDGLNGVAWEDDGLVKSVYIYFQESDQ
jgi:Holliday junction resolvase RusA-like endonuclease